MAHPTLELATRIFGAPGEAPRPIDGAVYFESLTDDVRYTVIGTTRFSGTFVGRDDIMARLIGPLFEALDGPLVLAVDAITGDGARVAVQGRGFAPTKHGGRYDNTYCFVLQFRDGKIATITEYLDTDLVRTALG